MAETQTEAQETSEAVEPIVVYRSEDLSGATYALNRRSRERLKRRHPNITTAPRVFVAFETAADYGRGFIHRLVVPALTGLSEDRLKDLGPVEFWDPVTEERIA